MSARRCPSTRCDHMAAEMVQSPKFKMDPFSGPISRYNRRIMRSVAYVVAGPIAVICAAFILIHAPSVRADEGSVPFPDGYRAWTFLHSSLVPAGFPGFSKSPCVKPCTNGIFHFYANELAMKGLRTGFYADGAIIAEEMLEFLVGDKGNGGEGRRVLTAVMVKDNRRFAVTGGWGFG